MKQLFISHLPANYYSSPNTGSVNDFKNSDTDTGGKTALIVLADNEFNMNVDAGLYMSLPVTLISFNAKTTENNVRLSWPTSSEMNSDYFDIDRRLDAKSWINVGRVKSNGESATVKNYTFVDTTSVPGQNFYRLRMVDTDMSYAYSRIISIHVEGKERLWVYPNPVSDNLFIKNLTTSKIQEVTVINSAGKTVYTTNRLTSNGINLKKLPTRIYILRMRLINGALEVRKLVVER